jgi:hypothetical protein
MNNMDPSHRFTIDAVRAFEPGSNRRRKVDLNAVAAQIAGQYRRETLSPVMVGGYLRLGEFLILALAGAALFFAYVGMGHGLDLHYAGIILLASGTAILIMDIWDCYQLPALRRPATAISRIAVSWLGTFALMATVAFLFKVSQDFSRLWFGAWFVTGLGLLAVLRFIMAMQIRRWARNGRMERRAVIVGGGKNAEALIRSIEAQPYNDIRICGIFDDRDDTRSPPVVAGYPKLGNVAELIEFARIARIDMLIVALPMTAENARPVAAQAAVGAAGGHPAVGAFEPAPASAPAPTRYIGAVPMLDIFDRPINDWDSVAKRAFDIVFSLLGIIAFYRH